MSSKRKPIVVIESPFACDPEEMTAYARCAVHDSLMRGEAPFASHLLYTQPGVLEDADPREREAGLSAAASFYFAADLVAVYTDYGISDGMRRGIEQAKALGVRVEERQVETTPRSRLAFPLTDNPDDPDMIDRKRLVTEMRVEALRLKPRLVRETIDRLADQIERGDL